MRGNAQTEDDSDWDYEHSSIEVFDLEEEEGLIPSSVLNKEGQPIQYYYNKPKVIGFDLRKR